MRGFARPFGGSFLGSSNSKGMRVAVSSPTSISTLMVSSPGVQLFHLTDGPRIVGTRLIKAIQRGNLVVIGTRQGILRLNHFDIVGHARAKTVTRLIHFFARELDAQIRDLHLVPR